MSNPLHNALNRALSIRLGMQISLSALPIVEEWMDADLARWMESVPLPPELPIGHDAHFAALFGSDLSRLEWRAYGNPGGYDPGGKPLGFVPKLVEYFDAIKIPRAELQLLDDIGTALQPALVGTWIAVARGAIAHGWHFCDEHPLAGLLPFLADSPARAALTGWLADAGIEKFSRFSQSLDAAAYSEIELPLPGVSPDDRLAAASRAFAALSGEPLPAPVIDAMAAAGSTEFSAAVRIRGGEIARVSVLSPGLPNDAIAALCAEAPAGVGVPWAAEHVQVQAALGAEGADRVSYSRDVAGAASVDLVVLPTENQRPNPRRMN